MTTNRKVEGKNTPVNVTIHSVNQKGIDFFSVFNYSESSELFMTIGHRVVIFW